MPNDVNVWGFHTAPAGNQNDIGLHWEAIHAASGRVVIKAADLYGNCDVVARLAREADLEHSIVFRIAEPSHGVELPDYNLPPEQAAIQHWAKILAVLPPEFDKEIVWLEVINEPDKERLGPDGYLWVAQFMYHIGLLAIRDGYRVCGPGFSSGEPEPEDWYDPWWKKYLLLCAQYPSRIAIALHEYSFNEDDIFATAERDPQTGEIVKYWHIGRYTWLLRACDDMGIPWPWIFFTEWGWNERGVPSPGTAIMHLTQVQAQLFDHHPCVKMAAIWDLGGGYDPIQHETQKLIDPVTQFALTLDPLPEDNGGSTPMDCPEATVDGARRHIWRPRHLSNEQWAWIHDVMENGLDVDGNDQREVIGYEGWSHKDALTGISRAVAAGFTQSRLIILDGHLIGTGLDEAWMQANCPSLIPYTRWFRVSPEEPQEFKYTAWPTDYETVTQHFKANPKNYAQFGLPGHDGIDIRAPEGSPIYAVADGEVVRIHTNPNTHNYGIHVRINHGPVEQTIYGHASKIVAGLAVGDKVKAGQLVMYSGNTGNSFGAHLHLGRKRLGETYTDPDGDAWPYNLFDPTPLIKHLAPDQFPDQPEPPKPEPGNAGFGLHASADPGDLLPQEFDMFRACRPDVIKVLSGHGGSSVGRLAAEHPGAVFIVRAFLVFGGRNISPQQFLTDTINDVRRALEHIGPGREVYIELHNEPNITPEGYLSTWASGVEFNTWLLEVLKLYRQQLPDVKYLYPGLSPGHGEPGFRQHYADFLSQSLEAALACDAVALHTYWNTLPGTIYPMDTAIAHVDTYIVGLPHTDLWITEVSNNKMDTPDNKAAQYIDFWKKMRERASIKGLTYFVASASDPLWGWGPGGEGQVWEGTNIATIVGSRNV